MDDFLKCDAVGCDHISLVGKITEEMVNMSCPKCGHNLLTQADFDDFVRVTRPMLEAARSLGLITQTNAPVEGGTFVRIGNHNGTFTMTPGVKPPPE